MYYVYVSIVPSSSTLDQWDTIRDSTIESIPDLGDYLYQLDGDCADLSGEIPYWAKDITGLISGEPDLVYAYRDSEGYVSYFGFDHA